MAKTFKKTSRRKVKYILSPKEANKVIQSEFTDSKGNKTNIIYDFKPQKINSPTIEIKNTSKYKGNK